MINKDTILSYANDNLTLLEWLKKTEQALENGVLSKIEWISESETTGHLKLTFADNTTTETNSIDLPKGPKGDTGMMGEQGKDGKDGKDGEDYLIFFGSPTYNDSSPLPALKNMDLIGFNRTPKVDDVCLTLYTYDMKKYVATCIILSVGTDGAKASIQNQLEIVKGDTGATPNLTIGTVDTLAPGQSATATITGTQTYPVLNLGIPQGIKGDTGSISNLYLHAVNIVATNIYYEIQQRYFIMNFYVFLYTSNNNEITTAKELYDSIKLARGRCPVMGYVGYSNIDANYICCPISDFSIAYNSLVTIYFINNNFSNDVGPTDLFTNENYNVYISDNVSTGV